MNDHKIAFIICTNNDLLLEETVHYMNHLIVPDGYMTDLLTIQEASSITAGYCEAMSQTDAKYKIYMHQDVFILNRNILKDLLSIFQSDPRIGMVGMVGYDTVSPDGIMWHKKRLGNLYERKPNDTYPALSQYQYSLTEDGYFYAAEIDGFFMATACDLPWNTEVLKGWDFYDAFQSIHYLTSGYKIVVPIQKYPWCMHDDNKFPNLTNYNYYRKLFMQTYPHYLGKSYKEILNCI